IFLERQADINYLNKFDFFESSGRQIIELTKEQFSLFKTYFDLIQSKSLENDLHTSEIVRSLIYIILNEIDSAYQLVETKQTTISNRGNYILYQFKKLLAKHFIHERQIPFYAEKLHLTPKYFSTLIRQVSGK